MGKMAGLMLLSLVANAVQLLHGQPYQVNKQKMIGCETIMGIQPFPSTIGRGVQNAPCTGLLTLDLNGNVRKVCSDPDEYNKASAERLCYTLGLNMYRKSGRNAGVRLYRCDIYVENDDLLPKQDTTLIHEAQADSLFEQRCNREVTVTGFDCFDKCYFGENRADNQFPRTTIERFCDESLEPYWGITCTDVNECLNGVLFECTGPFDGSCTQRKACGANTTCTNIVGSYECACRNGYEPARGYDEDPYDTGCVDVNECEEELTCGMTGQCQNTLGSYICLCPQGQSWSDEQKTCRGPLCTFPRIDPNAEAPVYRVSPTEQASFLCRVGFKTPNNTDSYTMNCVGGRWEDKDFCRDVNECFPSQCDANAICTNFPGSFICRCADGYVGNGRTCTEIDPCEDYLMCLYGECTVVYGEPQCRCDSNYEGIACDRPIVSAALVVAISTLITMAILTSIITVVLWTRGVNLNPTKPPLDPVYGARPALPGRGPFRLPPYRPRML